MFSKVLVAFALILGLHILWKRRKYYGLLFKVPGPIGYPLLGMAHALIRREEILKIFAKYEGVYGPFFYSWLGPKPILIVSEPQIVQDILTSPYCVNKGIMYEAVNEGAGNGLFGLNEPEWTRHRKLLNPAFSYKTLTGLVPIFNRETEKLLSIFEGHCEKGEINIMKTLQKFTLSLAAKTTMGEDLVTKSINNELLGSYQCLLETMTSMCFSPWLRIKFVRWLYGIEDHYRRSRSKIRFFIRNLVSKKLAKKGVASDSKESINDKSSFLDLAIQLLRKGYFTYEDVENEANVIVFGAFETTANTIGYMLMLLAMFPCQQQKLFEEIKSSYPDRGEFEVKVAEMQQLVFLDMVLNESMRLMAPVPLIARVVSKNCKLSNDVTIPAGVQIAIDIFNMHRRLDIWGPDAHKFNPEHFLPSNLEGKHSYAFIPFTKGIRNCIGWRYALLSVKVAIIKLIRNYHFKTSFNFEDLNFVEDITLKLKKTPLLELSQRNS